MKSLALILLFCLFLTGCVGLGTVKKTNSLVLGMTMQEVNQVLGNPSQASVEGDKIIWKYSLHQYFKGWVPYYLVFDQETKVLKFWASNEEEYYQDQSNMLEAFRQVNYQRTQENASLNAVNDEKKDLYKEYLEQKAQQKQEDYREQQLEYQKQQLNLQQQKLDLNKYKMQIESAKAQKALSDQQQQDIDNLFQRKKSAPSYSTSCHQEGDRVVCSTEQNPSFFR